MECRRGQARSLDLSDASQDARIFGAKSFPEAANRRLHSNRLLVWSSSGGNSPVNSKTIDCSSTAARVANRLKIIAVLFLATASPTGRISYRYESRIFGAGAVLPEAEKRLLQRAGLPSCDDPVFEADSSSTIDFSSRESSASFASTSFFLLAIVNYLASRKLVARYDGRILAACAFPEAANRRTQRAGLASVPATGDWADSSASIAFRSPCDSSANFANTSGFFLRATVCTFAKNVLPL
jgi:hypothetical protein